MKAEGPLSSYFGLSKKHYTGRQPPFKMLSIMKMVRTELLVLYDLELGQARMISQLANASQQ